MVCEAVERDNQLHGHHEVRQVFSTVYASQVGDKSGCALGTWMDDVFVKRRPGAPDPAVDVLWLSMNSTPASEQADCRCRFHVTMALLRLCLPRAGMMELSLREACGKILLHRAIKSDHAASETGPPAQLLTPTWRIYVIDGVRSCGTG